MRAVRRVSDAVRLLGYGVRRLPEALGRSRSCKLIVTFQVGECWVTGECGVLDARTAVNTPGHYYLIVEHLIPLTALDMITNLGLGPSTGTKYTYAMLKLYLSIALGQHFGLWPLVGHQAQPGKKMRAQVISPSRCTQIHITDQLTQHSKKITNLGQSGWATTQYYLIST